MVALQGPESRAVLEPLLECEPPLAELRYYRIARARCADAGALVATTGYTGEPGYEVYLPAGAAPAFWDRVLETGGDRLAPVGLGARDTLRVEAGMPLYGQEIDRRTSPYEAGLGFAVDLDKGTPFVGREALAGIRAAGVQRKLVGLRIDSRKVARAGMPLFQKERQIGHVTSGIPSPTLGHPIAMALIESDVRQPDGIEVEIRGTRFPALPEPLPFYSRTRKRAARAL